jgi:hypothetical protein
MKPVLSASLLLTMLCGPALAGTVPVTYAIDLATKTEHHTLFVTDKSCAEIQAKSRDRESFFRVCASASENNYVRLDIDRRTRDKEDEARTSAVVVAAPGASYDLLDTKLTVKTK